MVVVMANNPYYDGNKRVRSKGGGFLVTDWWVTFWELVAERSPTGDQQKLGDVHSPPDITLLCLSENHMKKMIAEIVENCRKPVENRRRCPR